MTKQHFENAMNGGPLTLEFHNSMFKDEDSVEKVAMLVKSFVELGGHQLQINAVNREKLKDAQLFLTEHMKLVWILYPLNFLNINSIERLVVENYLDY